MSEIIFVWVFFGLPAWWAAQALLFLRDYFDRRHEIRRMPPPTQDEVEAIARIHVELPQKEKPSWLQYREKPAKTIAYWWWLVSMPIFFRPISLFMRTLPPLETRLSPENLKRFKSESL